MKAISEGSAQRPSLRPIVMAVVLAMGFVTVAAYLAGCSCNKEPEPVDTIEAPDVEGMTEDDAIRVLEAEDFQVGTIVEEFSETIHEGNVISQDPKPGTEVAAGITINLVVSKGSNKPPEQVSMPNLIGMTQAEAEQALFNLRLVPVVGDPAYTTEAAPGRVFRQAVPAGTALDVGTKVGFTSALGSEVIAVPSVIGLTRDAAVNALTAAGFGVDVHEEYNASVAAGSVIWQNPSPRIQCVRGTTVAFSVSLGAAPVGLVEVPNLATLTLPMSVQILNSAGLLLNPSGSDMNGTVISQSPAPGTKVQRGTVITAQFEPVYL